MSQNIDLSKIAPIFHDDVAITVQTIIQNNENIIWAGNITQLTKDSTPFPFGYLLITSKRTIRVLFESEYDSSSGFLLLLSIFLWPLGLFLSNWSKRPYFEIELMLHADLNGYRAVDLPQSPLTQTEKNSRKIVEYPLEHISTVQRQDVRIQNQNGKPPAKAKSPVNLKISFFPDKTMSVLFYDSQDAKEVYDLLMGRLLNNKEVSKPISASSDFSVQLQKLAELHASNVLSDDEYENAKKRLLG